MQTNKTGYFKQKPALLRRGGQANQERLRQRAQARQAPDRATILEAFEVAP